MIQIRKIDSNEPYYKSNEVSCLIMDPGAKVCWIHITEEGLVMTTEETHVVAPDGDDRAIITSEVQDEHGFHFV